MNLIGRLSASDTFLAFVASIHLVWAAIVVIDDSVMHITAVHEFTQLFQTQAGVAIAISTVAILAHLGVMTRLRDSFVGILCLIPQQFALVVTAAGIITAISTGVYPDGYEAPSKSFIFADQSPLLLLCIFHSMALIQRIAYRQ